MKSRRARDEPFQGRQTRTFPRRRLVAPPRTGGFRGQTAPFRRAIAERKVIDVDANDYTCSTAGSITLLNGVAVGSDYTDRVGRKIRLKSLYIRGMVGRDSILDNFQQGPCLARLLIVSDSQTNGAAPLLTDILKEATSTSQLNLNNRDRFKVLIDKQYVVAPIVTSTTNQYATSGSPTNYSIKKYKKLNHEVLFNGTSSTVGSISTGAIWMVWVGDKADDTAQPTGAVSVRIRFEDA